MRGEVLAVGTVDARGVHGHEPHAARVEPADQPRVDRREVAVPVLVVGVAAGGEHQALGAERHAPREVRGSHRAAACAVHPHDDARPNVEVERLFVDRTAALAVVHGRVGVRAEVHGGLDRAERDVVALVHVHQRAAPERGVAGEDGGARGQERGDVDQARHGQGAAASERAANAPPTSNASASAAAAASTMRSCRLARSRAAAYGTVVKLTRS